MRGSVALRLAFVAVHAVLAALALFGPGYPLGDVQFVYRFWVELGISSDYWVGIDAPWVYPVVAMIPMLGAHTFGGDAYDVTWVGLVVVLNAAAFLALTGVSARCRNRTAAWWWMAFLLALGPIALGRIDSITVPLGIVGVLLIAKRPHAAGIVLAIATWMKVWPAALLAALVVACRERWSVAAGALGLSVCVVVTTLALGGAPYLFSFVAQQGGRGLQIEAPVSLIWLWQGVAGVPGAGVYYDDGLLTYQVTGSGVDVAAALMTPLLAVIVGAILALSVTALRHGGSPADLLAPLALAIVVAMIVVNKVGSPQFITWLAVPVILGLVRRRAKEGGSFAIPAGMTIAIAALTQVIYPYLYGELVALTPVMVGVLSVRSLLLALLLAWAVRSILAVAREGARLQVAQGPVAVQQDAVGDRPLS